MASPAPQNHFWAQHHSILLELLLPQMTSARDLVRLAQTCKAARGVLREERVASLWLRRARFGADFHPGIALAAKHNSLQWNFHFGCQFFTSHPAYQLEVEASLRAVDPSISHPYWDFMEDAGSNWSPALISSGIRL